MVTVSNFKTSQLEELTNLENDGDNLNIRNEKKISLVDLPIGPCFEWR